MEEEVRRLRRDLHDGLGPMLAALDLQAGAIRTLAHTDTAGMDALIQEWRNDMRVVMVTIRRIVSDLRPPAIDELGLAGALRQLAALYALPIAVTERIERSLPVEVQVSEPLPALPAAVEVAIYRIAQEALTNAARHAHATQATLHLSIDDAVHLTVIDDGRGLPSEVHLGMGLRSMRERAEELGGQCAIAMLPTGGTSVCVTIPFVKDGE